ncbi:MAG: type II toxin-antitoxin system RelE/ParE family toxin [Acetobacter sp.]|nr:type II toxin-antitoxin system RelE/ParE family toxin [Acetobacter sp.]MBO6085977.1 type II toxin-antitoxin system RelE/ParE family toxin [Acetobacter sp.]MBO6091063.1 type II toxin-antitoxin system RelE/ParE family toxin [Acetobacter sp.]
MMKYVTEKTEIFEIWLKKLRDKEACTRISRRLKRIEKGNFGDHKFLGGGISELRIDYGPGYRVYYTERSGMIILLLAGGDKSTQERDIAKARQLAQEWKG